MSLIPLLLILTLTNGQTLTDIFESTSFTVIANITNAFTEGPLWRNSTNTLLFSNSAANAILEWNPKGMVITTYKSPCNSSNGLVFDSQRRLIVCEQSSKRISRSLGSGTETLAHTWSGLTFNSPNDIALRSDGSIYFTDPPYFGSQFQMNFSGVFRVFPNQTVVTVATDFDRPNGIAFSVDEKTLYIDDTTRNHVRAFDVAQDGTVSNSRVFITNVPNPDGMKVDSNGNLYVTSANGLNVYKPDGTLIGVVPKPTCTSDCFPSNVAFGDADFKGVYLTARNYLYRLQGKIAGKPTDGTLLSTTSGSESPSSSSFLFSSSIQTYLLLMSALWNLLH